MRTRDELEVADAAQAAGAAEMSDGPTVHVVAGAARHQKADPVQTAASLAVTEDLAAQVGFLLEHVGGRTAAAALGLSDRRQLTKWWFAKSAPKAPAMRERVHLLFQVCYAITFAISGAAAERFLLSGNPSLGDEAPLVLIRGDVAEARVPVLRAVRVFIE